MDENQTTTQATPNETKFCKECGQKIAKKAVVCPHCGCQIEAIGNENAAPAQIVINNSNQNSNQNNNVNGVVGIVGRAKKNGYLFFCSCFLDILGHINFMKVKREWEYSTSSHLGCLA